MITRFSFTFSKIISISLEALVLEDTEGTIDDTYLISILNTPMVLAAIIESYYQLDSNSLDPDTLEKIHYIMDAWSIRDTSEQLFAAKILLKNTMAFQTISSNRELTRLLNNWIATDLETPHHYKVLAKDTILKNSHSRDTTLDLSKLHLRTIPPLSQSTHIESLHLNRNELTTLHSQDLAGLNNLTELFLNNNQLHHIDDDAFDNLLRLDTLILNGNALSTVPSLTEKNTPNLTWLILSQNLLTEPPCIDLPKLEVLFITDNQLRELPPLKSSTQLKNLRACDNQLVSLPAILFLPLNHLKWVDFSNNCLRELHPLTLCNAPNLTGVSLNNNQLTYLPDNFLLSSTNLQSLYLKNNRLTTLPQHGFHFCDSLEAVYLQQNNITDLSSLTTHPTIQKLLY